MRHNIYLNNNNRMFTVAIRSRCKLVIYPGVSAPSDVEIYKLNISKTPES
jgi:hypothetical protein